jgi:hypothetical protein
MVPMEGVEPTHSYEYQILSLARLPIPPHRLSCAAQYKSPRANVNKVLRSIVPLTRIVQVTSNVQHHNGMTMQVTLQFRWKLNCVQIEFYLERPQEYSG